MTTFRTATLHSESSGDRRLLQAQFLHSLGQVLVIDLKNNLKSIIRSGKDVRSGVLTIYRLACGSLKTHTPDHFYQHVLRVQRRYCERVDVRGHQSPRTKEFFAPGKNFQEVFFLHALNTRRSAKQEDVSITTRNLLHVKHPVCRLVVGEERVHLDILVAHPLHDSRFFGAGGAEQKTWSTCPVLEDRPRSRSTVDSGPGWCRLYLKSLCGSSSAMVITTATNGSRETCSRSWRP